ncbi:DUF1810 family protein [Mycolicibacterium sarraceniae]|uniref:Uncharacterized protein n=1 Tax=Mycolicibacterium sarraceniae TaxID=1534348 RepID=A0A7I7SUW3_9MYCO|nr:DUF1810 family protein [Mycolicibacterium sarraceniae]BBY60807.1 hypothetical protein MSAR_39430 [Mycolicibacterium sarraceniae]
MEDPFDLQRFVDAWRRGSMSAPRCWPPLRAPRSRTAIEGASIKEIFPWPESLKVRSSMTLFARAATDNADFLAVLDPFYSGHQDPRTLELL